METLGEKLQGPTDWLRNTLMLPDRRMSAGLAIGALAFSGITELSAHRFPETNVIGRFARRSLRLAALTTFALALWQTERVGELKEQPKRTSVEVPRERIEELSLTLQGHLERSKQFAEEAEETPLIRGRNMKLQIAHNERERASGVAEAADIIKLPMLDGAESWSSAVSNTPKPRATL